MEAVLTNILNVVPGWLALALMLGGFAFYVLGAFTGYCSLAVALTAAVVVGKITNNKLLPLAPFLSGAGMAAIIFREVLISC